MIMRALCRVGCSPIPERNQEKKSSRQQPDPQRQITLHSLRNTDEEIKTRQRDKNPSVDLYS